MNILKTIGFITLIFLSGCGFEEGAMELNAQGDSFVRNHISVIRFYLAVQDDLSEEEIAYIKTTEPQYSFYMGYCMGGLGDFSWCWDMPDGITISVLYSGGIDHIDVKGLSYTRNENEKAP